MGKQGCYGHGDCRIEFNAYSGMETSEIQPVHSEVRESNTTTNAAQVEKWKPPTYGSLKMNVDASVYEEDFFLHWFGYS